MKLAFILINFHSDEDSLSIIKDIEKNTFVDDIELAIYAVDNSRSSKFRQGLKKYPHSHYVASPGNLGFAAGNNLGIRKALADGSEIICLINNDTQAPKDLIKNIIRSPIAEPEVGAVGGLIYFAKGFEFHDRYKPSEKGKVIWYGGGKFDWDNILGSGDHVDEVDKGQCDKVTETGFITGALFITRADILKQVGFFDERFFMYLEDVDLSIRIKRAGYRLLFDPGIKIWHKVAQSSGIGSELNDYFITRNRLYFGMKYAKLRTKLALLKEAIRLWLSGRPAQKQGINDFFTGRLGKGSYIKT